ncbi:DUF2680 domain-containing protein [Dethiothermospora halolimnae]|uniref:DUF2680 domain-containing protein n=1 Tax=Dethiothermospora halolimnae TaxID=3114390 RepID=UPI003CCC27EE
MKKVLSVSLLLVLVLSVGTVTFAAADGDAPDWFNDMLEWRRDRIDEAVENGTITEEQAEYWNERMEYMEEYHNENGFDFPAGCHGGYGRGMGRGFGRGNGQGFGPGMMNGQNWNN